MNHPLSFLRRRDASFRWPIPAALVLAFLLAWQADGAATHPPGKRLLLFVGSNTLGERAIPEMAKAWLETEKKAQGVTIHPSYTETSFVTGELPEGGPVYIEVHATGSGDCFKSFYGSFSGASSPCDIGMSSRRINDDEAAALQQKLGSDFTQHGSEPGRGCEHPIGMDGLAIVVQSSNPLTRISFSDLQAIYSRKKKNWSELAEWSVNGGAAAGLPIVPLRRREPSGTLDLFKERIKPDAAPMSDERAIASFTSGDALAERAATTPGAIGFVSQGAAFHQGLKRLQVYDDSKRGGMAPEEAVFPDPEVVHRGAYPLARTLYLYTGSVVTNQDVPSFVRFALGAQGQTVLRDKGKLLSVEGTHLEITKQESGTGPAAPSPVATPGPRKKKVILRLSGSNTVGAECAVNLAYNYFAVKKQGNGPLRIEDETSALETPEGEKALAHDVMCDLRGDGTWSTIQIRPTGSGDAFRDLYRGACDIGMSSRPISEAERRDLLKVCGELTDTDAQFALGLDAMAIVAAKENPVEKITIEQVRRIFLGEIENWAEIGGAKLPIKLHARPERSGTYRRFCDSVLFGRSVASSAQRHAENAVLSQAVAADPAGIGFVSMSQVDSAKMLPVGYESGTSFTAPSEESVRSGRYPKMLCRYVYLYVPPEPPKSFTVEARQNWECAHEFAELSQGWRGQAVVASSGFIPDTNPIDDADQARRQPNEPILTYVQRLGDLEKKALGQKVKLHPKLGAEGICAQVFFEPNQLVLTAESRNAIDRKLASWLKFYLPTARSPLIAEGWTDSDGSEESSKLISLQRAQTVAKYIHEKLGYIVTPEGKGKSFDPPNNTEENKQQNRRVVIRVSTADLESPTAAAPTPLPKIAAKKKPKP